MLQREEVDIEVSKPASSTPIRYDTIPYSYDVSTHGAIRIDTFLFTLTLHILGWHVLFVNIVEE